MEVTSTSDNEQMTDPLIGVVLAELRALRKTPLGLTPDSIAEAPVLVALLGAGDEGAAFAQLTGHLLGEADLSVLAAGYSLGLGSSASGLLNRLNDFGNEYGYEQRQVRRYSDRGLSYIANRVVMKWSSLGAPTLSLVITQPHPNGSLRVLVQSAVSGAIMMQSPTATFSRTRTVKPVVLKVVKRVTTDRMTTVSFAPLEIFRDLCVRWPGELLPRHHVTIVGVIDGPLLQVQTNGNTIYVSR